MRRNNFFLIGLRNLESKYNQLFATALKGDNKYGFLFKF